MQTEIFTLSSNCSLINCLQLLLHKMLWEISLLIKKKKTSQITAEIWPLVSEKFVF